VSYNCFAFAAHDTRRVWSPTGMGSGKFCPTATSLPLDNVGGYLAAYAAVGFEQCADRTHEEGYEKIAIFAKPEDCNDPVHASIAKLDRLCALP
jgi:hypothetical protein